MKIFSLEEANALLPTVQGIAKRIQRAHSQVFFRWYNIVHRHSGIAMMTPTPCTMGMTGNSPKSAASR